MNLEQILAKSLQLHRLKKDQEVLFAELQKVSPEVLDEWEQVWAPKENFWPVITLRYLLLQKLRKKEDVNLAVIEELKTAISNRDISDYGDFNKEFLASLKNYPQNEKGMFPQWQEPFKILYQFFYTNQEKEQVVKLMKFLGEEIISRYQIPDAKVHIVGFDGGQNYGSQRTWGVIIPKKAGGPREAYQILFAANEGKIEGGLYMGHGLKDSGFEIRRKVYENWEVYLEDVKNFLPRWQELNNQLDFSFSKNESALKKVLGKIKPEDRDIYFTLIDEVVDELKIPNEKNLVFSIALPGLSFQVGKRYCLNLKKNRFSFLAPTDYLLEGFEKEEFTHGHKALLYHGFTGNEVINHYPFMARAIQHEIERDANVSEYHYDNAAFRQAVFDKEYRSTLFAPVIEIKLPQKPKIKEMPDKCKLNLILFGPPGTGKTYNTINIALEILGTSLEGKSREETKAIFEEKIKQERIVFTTFHQSLSYEDFIEGIKPEADKEKEFISYSVQSGIFKKICVDAAFSISLLTDSKETEKVLDFSLAYDNFTESLEEQLSGNESVTLETKTGGRIFVDSISQQGNIIIFHQEGTRKYTISKVRLSKLHQEIDNLDDVNNINDQFREIIGGSNSSAYWAVLNAIRKSFKRSRRSKEERSYTWEEKIQVVQKMKMDDYKNRNAPPYVLVIDEINRGNVSQIFGELITLIEQDKRAGMSEALQITLPYSRDIFSVPPNLYIIGTMNTADRSVEALDTALRRRFSFTEIPPEPELIITNGSLNETNGFIDDIDVVKLLEIINKRLEKLIDKDHRIGHSYFMNIKTKDELVLTFKDKIIPLLEEYFFGDFGKIGLVLGNSFVEKVTDDAMFASFDDYDPIARQDLVERPVYKIKHPNEWNFSSIYQ